MFRYFSLLYYLSRGRSSTLEGPLNPLTVLICRRKIVFIDKLPDDFTQTDVEGYLQSMLSRKPVPAEAQFKHFVYGLKYYLRSSEATRRPL
jgi:hypothetical protein